MSMTAFLWIVFAALFSCAGNIFIKMASTQASPNNMFWDQYLNIFFIIGACFFGINLLFFGLALKTSPVSIAYPILATLSFVALTISAAMFLSEQIRFQQYLGLVVCLFGVWLLAFQPKAM